MNIEKKAFITRGSELSLLELAAQLKQKRGIDTAVRQKTLLVDQKDYHEALRTGATIAVNTMLNEIMWVDANDKVHNIGFIPVMHIVEPMTGTDPKAKIEYLRNLKEFCEVKEMKIEETGDGFDILMYKPFTWHELMVKRCRGFNYVYDKNPFFKIIYLPLDESCQISVQDIEDEVKSAVTTYIENSLLHDLIGSPVAQSIAPLICDRKIGNISLIGSSSFKIEKAAKIEDLTFMFGGSFEANSISPDLFIGKCKTTDSGNFESILSVTREEVTITTNILASRTVSGNVFLPTYFDNFFTDLKDHQKNEKKKVTEHFIKIGGGKRLLHFSDEYDFFEMFDLPDNWLIERGLRDLPHPKVFDNFTFDLEDRDLEEARKIIEETKMKAKAISMKPTE